MKKSFQSTIYSFVLALLLNGCLTTPKPPIVYSGSKNYSEVSSRIHRQKNISLATFHKRGPFKYEIIENNLVPISRTQTVLTDLLLPKQKIAAPLIIISHGNKSTKETHRFQAERLASWGFNVLVLGLPNQYRWLENGKTIAKVATLVHNWPYILADNIDTSNIILMGHSFGGSAVTIAAGSGAPIKGVILLDPAVVAEAVVGYMKNIQVPAILLGADQKVFKSRRRSLFYKNISSEMLEISIKGATHNDAQYPSDIAMRAFGFDWETTPELQERFMASIVTSVVSITDTNSTYFAWQIFKKSREQNELSAIRIKPNASDLSKYARFTP